MKYLMLVCLLIPMNAYSFDEWDKAEIVMEAAYIALHIVDWGQTLNIADDCEEGRDRHEHNPILGDSPSKRKVNTYFAAGLVVQPLIAHILPSDWRKAWIASGIVLELGCGLNNHRIGIKCSF